jgi:hypothetical protein
MAARKILLTKFQKKKKILRELLCELIFVPLAPLMPSFHGHFEPFARSKVNTSVLYAKDPALVTAFRFHPSQVSLKAK